MKIALMLCWLYLEAAFSNPLQIHQKDVLDETVKEYLSNITTVGPLLPENKLFQDILNEIAINTNSVQPDISSSQSLDQSNTLEPKNSPEDTSEDTSENTSENTASEEDDTSESKSLESTETTSEEKTSEESDLQSQDKSYSDEDGDTRRDSQESEEHTLKNGVTIFPLIWKEENDTMVNGETSKPEQLIYEETRVVNISKAGPSDDGTNDNIQTDESMGGQNHFTGCQQGVNYDGCDSREFVLQPDNADDSLMPDNKQRELQLR